ncbi:MAG: hypothetical protein MHPSP_003715, partial [Paramarteilia canceri]
IAIVRHSTEIQNFLLDYTEFFGTILLETSLLFQEYSTAGFHMVIDCDNFTEKEAKVALKSPLHIAYMAKLPTLFPARIRGIHIIHAKKHLETLIRFCKSVMPNKLAKRIYLHENLEDLFKILPKTNFPIEYGGESTSFGDLS